MSAPVTPETLAIWKARNDRPVPREAEVALVRLGSSGIVHTDYLGLGCGAFGPGDWTSGHRPETTCPACRANLVREGGMAEGMFYGPAVPARGYHLSDCALHNEPAMAAGPCDCADREATPAGALEVRTHEVLHLLDSETDEAVCGAHLVEEPDSDFPDWTEERGEVTCEACGTRHDERQFDRDEESRAGRAGMAAYDRAVDRDIEARRER